MTIKNCILPLIIMACCCATGACVTELDPGPTEDPTAEPGSVTEAYPDPAVEPVAIGGCNGEGYIGPIVDSCCTVRRKLDTAWFPHSPQPSPLGPTYRVITTLYEHPERPAPENYGTWYTGKQGNAYYCAWTACIAPPSMDQCQTPVDPTHPAS